MLDGLFSLEESHFDIVAAAASVADFFWQITANFGAFNSA
jgi:hypothetical protein